MKLLSISNHRLPGISGFLKRNPMFQQKESAITRTTKELVKETFEALRAGKYQVGDQFPNPGQIAEITGASLVDSLETVTTLLKSGAIRQNSSGRLSISPRFKK